jgi:hypothetical protein
MSASVLTPRIERVLQTEKTGVLVAGDGSTRGRPPIKLRFRFEGAVMVAGAGFVSVPDAADSMAAGLASGAASACG